MSRMLYPLAAGVMIAILATLLLACGDESPESSSVSPATSSPDTGLQPSPTTTVTIAPYSTPTTSPNGEGAPSGPAVLVFQRSGSGGLWFANLDGSDARSVTPVDEEVSFVGLDAKSGSAQLYYLAEVSASEYELRVIDLATESVSVVHRITYRRYRNRSRPAVSLDPFGKRVAIADGRGLNLLDLDSGDETLVLANDFSGCDDDGPVEDCFYYWGPIEWSSDGKKMLVGKGLYEFGAYVVLDGFLDGSVLDETEFGVGGGSWSPSSESVCLRGYPDGGGPLWVAEAPDWIQQRLGPEHGDTGFVRDIPTCVFLDASRIAFVEENFDSITVSVALVDVNNGSDYLVATVELGEDPWNFFGRLMAAGEDVLVLSIGTYSGSQPEWKRPLVIDVNTGTVVPVLEEGDTVVAVVDGTDLLAGLANRPGVADLGDG